jgi:carbon storage regulator
MLVLTRKPGEKVVIGNGITVTVVEVRGKRVRVGIEAPGQVRLLRGERACWQEEPAACDGPADPA